MTEDNIKTFLALSSLCKTNGVNVKIDMFKSVQSAAYSDIHAYTKFWCVSKALHQNILDDPEVSKYLAPADAIGQLPAGIEKDEVWIFYNQCPDKFHPGT